MNKVMRLIKMAFVLMLWLGITGFEGPGCVPSDTMFGHPPKDLDPEYWNGWWKTSWAANERDEEGYVLITVSKSVPGEIVVEDFGMFDDDLHSRLELRKAPGGNSLWFVFITYMCSDEQCAGYADNTDEGIYWGLLRSTPEVITLWYDLNEDRIEEAIINNEITGELVGCDDYRLLGSALSNREIRELSDSKYFRIYEDCPMILVKE